MKKNEADKIVSFAPDLFFNKTGIHVYSVSPSSCSLTQDNQNDVLWKQILRTYLWQTTSF